MEGPNKRGIKAKQHGAVPRGGDGQVPGTPQTAMPRTCQPPSILPTAAGCDPLAMVS